MDNKIGCSAGKTILIDPNNFDGQNSSSNISVPLEDLSIYVQLETTKKARTILTSIGDKNITTSSGGAIVRFIEGDEVGGKKVLTTNYTDLTTSFDESNQSEGLGITSIDIDFNSSYAPLIIINFVDLRGSAIFQNEQYISNNENKYATFFQLPYPLFELTIKGYYGMPVKYKLHMTKFNAKFNSSTGNFEITANFIGYTYAMLSDMLLGYLKAIPYTNEGAAKYKELKKSRNNILTLDELMQGISKIDEKTQKLKDTDPGVSDLSKLNNKLSLLDNLRVNMDNFGENMSILKDLNDYKFIIQNNDSNSDFVTLSKTNFENNKYIEEYNIIADDIVKLFNNDSFANITIGDEFKVKEINFYEGPSMRLLNPLTDSDLNFETTNIICLYHKPTRCG